MKTVIVHTTPHDRARIVREYRYGMLTMAEYQREDRRIIADTLRRQGYVEGRRLA